jgi:hypothetical protein
VPHWGAHNNGQLQHPVNFCLYFTFKIGILLQVTHCVCVCVCVCVATKTFPFSVVAGAVVKPKSEQLAAR